MVEKPTLADLEQKIKNLERELAESKEREKLLKSEQERYHHLFKSGNDAVFLSKLSGPNLPPRFLEVNEVACTRYGYTREEFLEMGPLDLDAEELHHQLPEIQKRLFKDKQLINETVHVAKDGTRIPVEISSRIIELDGEPALYAIIRDITERKLSEKALLESEKEYRRLFNSVNDAIHVNSFSEEGPPTEFLDVNEVACERYGYTREEFLKMTPADLTDKDFHDRFSEIKKELSFKNQVIFESVHITKDKSKIPVEISSRLFHFRGRPAALAIARDITDRKRSEELLKASEDKYRSLFNNANDAILLVGYNEEGIPGKYIDVNEVACKRYGYSREEFLNLAPWEIAPKDIYDKSMEIRKRIPVEKQLVFEFVHIAKDESRIPVEISLRVINYMGKPAVLSIARDITERKQAEEEKEKLQMQLNRAQRMEALGTLAGGIAHDFNNLLTGILGRTSLILNEKDSSHPDYEHFSAIEDLVKNAANLTKQLLGFARGGKYEVKPLDLNDLLSNSSEMFHRTKKEINIHIKPQKDLWAVEADEGQIEQVLLNLYVNAWQAMPGGGDLYLETENVSLDETYTRPFPIEPGEYVKVSVTDTGVGMDKETVDKIFEPFFTTKGMGRGTGLGLASAFGIMRNHNGIINVYSEKGKGTTFNLYLPVSDKKVIRGKETHQEILKGTETILFIDDENLVIDIGTKILQKLGYEVLVAGNGRDAVDLYKKDFHRIACVILDMIMPDMGGNETFDMLKEINPDVKVLLSSGYSINGIAQEILDKGCSGFIQKPFNMKQLSIKIREILDND